MNEELLNGRFALHYAADYGQVEVVLYLCLKGADVNVSSNNQLSHFQSAGQLHTFILAKVHPPIQKLGRHNCVLFSFLMCP